VRAVFVVALIICAALCIAIVGHTLIALHGSTVGFLKP
jgi:hypothetical protein